jgi:hypothetical protein
LRGASSRRLCQQDDRDAPAKPDENTAIWLWSKGRLFVAACLAGILHPALTYLRCNAIELTALIAFHVQLVFPWVMTTFRAIASLTRRSDSWHIASFDIGARGFLTINSSQVLSGSFPAELRCSSRRCVGTGFCEDRVVTQNPKSPPAPPEPLHDPVEPPAQDPPDRPLHDPQGDPTYEPPQPITEPTPNPTSDPPPEMPSDPL